MVMQSMFSIMFTNKYFHSLDLNQDDPMVIFKELANFAVKNHDLLGEFNEYHVLENLPQTMNT